jgi:hypothetical protein
MRAALAVALLILPGCRDMPDFMYACESVIMSKNCRDSR